MRPVLLAAMALAATGVAAQQPPRFSTSVDLQVVSVIARTATSALARGLTRDDFELLEDGKPVAISTFAEVNTDARTSVDDGRFIVLLLDDFGTDARYTERIKEAARGFARRMGPKDVMSLLLLNGSSSVTTQNPAEVLRAIDRAKGFGKAVLSTGGAPRHAMQTIASLSQQLAKVAHRRKVLVCIGAAQIFNPQTHAGRDRGEASAALRDAGRANLTTYVIDPLGLAEKPGLATQPIDAGRMESGPTGVVSRGLGFRDYRDGFAFESGGLAFANTNLYDEAISQVWDESGNYYLLGYEPARRDNRRHAIEVRVRKPDIEVRARRTRG
jgi:VWFA-related protein